MSKLRPRLTYANVMSSIAVFLVLGGAGAYAARKVGPHQLKANSVTTPKIKANAVTKRKLHKNAVATSKVRDGAIVNSKLDDGAVTGDKIADGSVTGDKIDAASTPFSRVTNRLRGTAAAPFEDGKLYPLSPTAYTQPAGRTDQYVAAVDVTFDAACEAPRGVQLFLVLDGEELEAPPKIEEIAGLAELSDSGTGALTRRLEFRPAGSGMARLAPDADTQHTFSVRMETGGCASGSGITVDGAGVDVIGTR